MARTSIGRGAVLGLFTALPVVGLSYLGNAAFSAAFLPYLLFEWVTRVLPGPILSASIEGLVAVITRLHIGPTSEVAKNAEKALAVALFLAGGLITGALVASVGRASARRRALTGLFAGALWLALFLAISASFGFRDASAGSTIPWFAALLLGWGALLGWAAREAAVRPETPAAEGRRRILAEIAGASMAFCALAVGLGQWLLRRRAQGTESIALGAERSPAGSPAMPARIEPAPGTRPELTPTEDFYRIDINLRAPRVDAAKWRLEIGGLVDHPVALTLDELRARSAITQVATLSCISNLVGGDLIGTARWTGLRLGELLRDLGLREGARAVFIESEDGFYESVSLEEAMDDRVLLVHAMNGAPLTPEHGSPLRIFIPNRYGMKQPKWIRRMTVEDRMRDGYWVERGWSREAIVQTTSVIDTARSLDMPGGRVTSVGGIAYAGARGISKVEVQMDDGPWQEATLRAPPLGPLTWVEWRLDLPDAPGRRTFRVRAYDGTGALQPVESRPPHPSGATGVHTLTTKIG